jgi:predicted RNA-binding Zn-ribbon protein involved in translation (DUF1610 family)
MTAPLCPACGEAAMITRTSRMLSASTREIYGACKVCGVQLKGFSEWTERLGDGLIPAEQHRAALPQSAAAARQAALDHYRRMRRQVPDNQLSLLID